MMSSDHLRPAWNGAASSPDVGGLPKGLRVLLVEDHFDTRASMEMVLRRADHYVRSAATAQRAVELAATEKFDVVITDLGLPDRSGIELMRDLHARHGLIGIATSG